MLQTLDGDRLGTDLERWEDEGGAGPAPWPWYFMVRTSVTMATRYVGPPGAMVSVNVLKEGEAPPPAPVNFRGIVK